MNYTELVALALSYSDREDAEVKARLDDFMRVVESRVNRKLQTLKMSTRAVIVTVKDQEYYGLPADYSGMRDIEIKSSIDSSHRTTLQYLSPEQMNLQAGNIVFRAQSGNPEQGYYTIIANQLHIQPTSEGNIIEIVYYQKVPPLTSTEGNNWLSDDNPDAYLFGLLVEISSFVKDAGTAAMWDERYRGAIGEIKVKDEIDRWAGTPMRIRAT